MHNIKKAEYLTDSLRWQEGDLALKQRGNVGQQSTLALTPILLGCAWVKNVKATLWDCSLVSTSASHWSPRITTFSIKATNYRAISWKLHHFGEAPTLSRLQRAVIFRCYAGLQKTFHFSFAIDETFLQFSWHFNPTSFRLISTKRGFGRIRLGHFWTPQKSLSCWERKEDCNEICVYGRLTIQ